MVRWSDEEIFLRKISMLVCQCGAKLQA
jgi:hypothetical protein